MTFPLADWLIEQRDAGNRDPQGLIDKFAFGNAQRLLSL